MDVHKAFSFSTLAVYIDGSLAAVVKSSTFTASSGIAGADQAIHAGRMDSVVEAPSHCNQSGMIASNRHGTQKKRGEE
jgi:hypothetical protein